MVRMVFCIKGMGDSPHKPKICSSHHLKKFPSSRFSPQNFYSPHQRLIPPLINHFYIIFISTSYSLHTQVMLILILIDVQYLQNVVFRCEKDSNGQMQSSSDSNHLIKKSSLSKISLPPHLKTLVCCMSKTLYGVLSHPICFPFVFTLLITLFTIVLIKCPVHLYSTFFIYLSPVKHT